MKKQDNQISSEKKYRTARHFRSQKRQAILAAVLTVLLLISMPVFAWLYYQRNMETVAMIKIPMALRIGEGDRNAIEALDLSKIDVTDENGYKDVVFCVYGKQKLSYNIQLAHTTNIGFTYTIYPATKNNSGNEIVKDQEGNEYSINTGNSLAGGYLNQDNNSKIANSDKHAVTYPDYESNYVQKNAEPLYWKTISAQTLTEQSEDNVWYVNYYVLRVSWANSPNIRNDKETDMIYLMAESIGTSTGT